MMYVLNGICPPSCDTFPALASRLQGDFCNKYQYHTWLVHWILYILWIYGMTHYIILCLTSALDTACLLDLLYDILFIAC